MGEEALLASHWLARRPTPAPLAQAGTRNRKIWRTSPIAARGLTGQALLFGYALLDLQENVTRAPARRPWLRALRSRHKLPPCGGSLFLAGPTKSNQKKPPSPTKLNDRQRPRRDFPTRRPGSVGKRRPSMAAALRVFRPPWRTGRCARSNAEAWSCESPLRRLDTCSAVRTKHLSAGRAPRPRTPLTAASNPALRRAPRGTSEPPQPPRPHANDTPLAPAR